MSEWKRNSAKAIGLSHETAGIPCQDDAKAAFIDGVNIIALSDGCGSSGISEIGSEAVVNLLCEFIPLHFDELFAEDELSIKKTITSALMERYEACLKENEHRVKRYTSSSRGMNALAELRESDIALSLNPRDLRTLYERMLFDATVLFAAVKGDRFLIGHCGDGFILGIKDKKLTIVSQEPKGGDSNETIYPSNILALIQAYGDEKKWDSFRILKGTNQAYSGFILLSDGSEKSLLRKTKGIYSPVLTNDSLLFEITANENEEDGKRYLTEILEKEYRCVENEKGESRDITEDDVSVAIMVRSDYSIEGVEEAKQPMVLSPIIPEKKDGIPSRPDLPGSSLSEEEKDRLAKLLGEGTPAFSPEKYKRLARWLDCAITLANEREDLRLIEFGADMERRLDTKITWGEYDRFISYLSMIRPDIRERLTPTIEKD